jgi:hypothetical protein
MERQMYMMGYDAIRPAEQQEVADLRRKLEAADSLAQEVVWSEGSDGEWTCSGCDRDWY